ncbi:MAG TPA: hypothetical protein VHZ49_20095 [Methylomirabilota bacterium]|jgi:hypothetical protein|nr:hypothetical protein [Methylomirabilota bacterium]
MKVNRAGPPKTHDRVTWRVPLSAPPSMRWQQSFVGATDVTSIATPAGVRFEELALTFRSTDDDVPVWIEYIDKWIAQANRSETDTHDKERRDAEATRDRRTADRQAASDANEKFKNL